VTFTPFAPARSRPQPAGAPGSAGPAGGGHRRRHRSRSAAAWLLAGSDAIAVCLVAVIARPGLARGACYGLLVLAGVAAAGLYQPRIGARVSPQASRLATAAALPALVLLAWTSEAVTLRLAGWGAALLIAARMAAAAVMRSAHRRGLLMRQTLIVGAGDPGQQVYRLLLEHPELGLRPCGAVDNQPADGALPLIGRIETAAMVTARFDIAQVLVCAPAMSDAELAGVLHACRAAGARVSVLPRPAELGLAVPRACLDEIWGTPFVPLRPGPDTAVREITTRLFDLTVGCVLLAAAAPLVLVLAVAVRLDLRLPPMFRQVRVVGRGKLAAITKLRTLHPGGDPDTTWAVTPEQCTRLGGLLRRTHADELPQLTSVVRGDMSLVGPRPERPYFAALLRDQVSGYADRERVRAGLTGWAQVHGLTGDTPIEDRARFDNFYIEYWSICLDLLVLARSGLAAVAAVLTRGGTR
jgi:lipopolysaccharide/colanic/teichoic acid biosynthesis glycosyltransferase